MINYAKIISCNTDWYYKSVYKRLIREQSATVADKRYLQASEVLSLDVVHLLELEVSGVGIGWHGPPDAEVVPRRVRGSLSGDVERPRE